MIDNALHRARARVDLAAQFLARPDDEVDIEQTLTQLRVAERMVSEERRQRATRRDARA